MRESQDSLHDLCFKLYAKGLTTRNIESITQEFSEEMGLFRSRPLEDQYSIFYLDATFISTHRETISKRSLLCGIGRTSGDHTRSARYLQCTYRVRGHLKRHYPGGMPPMDSEQDFKL